MLYFRMFLMMAVSLFTSRVVLQVLGESDYGIYNIVGGVVVFFSFMNNALLQATQRFLNFEIGKKEESNANLVFCMSMNAFLLLALIFILCSETFGLWFVNTKLNIPPNRIVAANWVYQYSIITFIICLIQIPYNAIIIAYEKMSVFAMLSLLEVFFKLLCVYLLYIISLDKLITFSFFYTLSPLLIVTSYRFYCNKHFPISRYRYLWDGNTFRKLFSFSSWSLFGSASNILASQGLNVLVNIFYGVAVNAALGIANQISSKVTQFVTNFQIAFNPQIVKLYAAKETESLYRLMFRSSKFSYYFMLLVSLPIILKMDDILRIWLADVPENTAIFSKLILCFMLIESVTGPLWMYVQATGVIRNYQLLMSFLIFLNLPISYIVLKLGFPVYSVWVVRIIVNVIVFSTRCIYIGCVYSFPISRFLRFVLIPVTFVSLLAVPAPVFVSRLNLPNLSSIIATTIVSIFSISIFIYMIGLTNNERNYLLSLVRKLFIHGK